jgi:hypothetical protein
MPLRPSPFVVPKTVAAHYFAQPEYPGEVLD